MDPHCNGLNDELENVQKRAARFVTRNYSYETGSMTGILEELKWETLQKRRKDKENPSLVFSGDREIPTRGSTVPVGNQALPSFPLERWTLGLGFPGSTVHQ